MRDHFTVEERNKIRLILESKLQLVVLTIGVLGFRTPSKTYPEGVTH
jgi:hypothetical protein